LFVEVIPAEHNFAKTKVKDELSKRKVHLPIPSAVKKALFPRGPA
jgi:hypothetical protein